jgi:hypothetical protein
MTGPLAALWIVALHHAAAVLGVVLILVTERVLWWAPPWSRTPPAWCILAAVPPKVLEEAICLALLDGRAPTGVELLIR